MQVYNQSAHRVIIRSMSTPDGLALLLKLTGMIKMENTGSAPQNNEEKRPKIAWKKWGRVDAWSLEEAVALSLNIVPGSLSKLDVKSPKKIKKQKTYDARLLVASRQAEGVIKPAVKLSDNGAYQGCLMVDPSSFVSFALSIEGWKKTLPKQFIEIGEFKEINDFDVDSNKGREKEIKAPVYFVAALIQLLVDCACRAQKIDVSFDVNNMPGVKTDFFTVAKRHNQSTFAGREFTTFDTYIKGLCKFRSGSKSSDFYKDLFPELKPTLGWVEDSKHPVVPS